jgi:hypothetical protein
MAAPVQDAPRCVAETEAWPPSLLVPGRGPWQKAAAERGETTSCRTVGDAGSVMVDNTAQDETEIVGGTETLGKLADPKRAGNKGPAAPRSGRFTGSIGDAGSHGVDPLPPQDIDSGYYRTHPAASFENVQRKLDLLRSRLSLRG